MRARAGIEELDRDLRDFRALIGASNATYARALEELAKLLSGPTADDALLDRLEAAWSARTFRAFYERPLLLLASMRADALASGRGHPLARSLAADQPDPAAVTAAAIVDALGEGRTRVWKSLRARRVQTNEPSRAIGWLLPARVLARGRPIVLVDVGCAAGLNLIGDRLPAGWRDPSGAKIDVAHGARVLARIGLDADPIDARHGDEVAWLRACIWAGEHARLERLEDAIDEMVATWHRRESVRLEPVRASAAPARLDAIEESAPPDALVLVYQTFLRDYLDGEESAAYERGMERWLERLTPGRGAWAALELEERTGPMPASLVVRVPTPEGPKAITLARMSYHPSIVDVSQAAVAELTALGVV